MNIKFFIDLPGNDDWSHLICGSLNELHKFMKQMNISVLRYHKGRNLPHYDIRKIEFEKILNNNIHKIEIVSSKEIVKILRIYYGDKK